MARWRDEWDEWGSSPRRRQGRTGLVALCAVLFVLGMVAGGGLEAHMMGAGQLPPVEQYQSAPTPSGNGQNAAAAVGQGSITQIYNAARPAIFTITVVSGKSNHTSEDIGTGFLINGAGDIVTNNHVVHGQKLVTVTGENGSYRGTVVGADPLDDLAIVHIQPPRGIKPLVLGTAKSLQPGQPLVAIGNPFQLTASVTSGIVSGLNRSMPSQGGREMNGLIQTDAPLNPGNSGGPLLNMAGQVVGINTAIESPVQGFVGIGFAIPIDRLKRLLPMLLKGQTITHPWLGIEAVDISPGVKAQYHLPVSKGILVISTVKNGPAAKAGLQGDTGGTKNPVGDGDIIVGINGQPVNSVAQLTAAISNYSVGTVVHLQVLRKDKKITVNVTLGSWQNP